MLGSLVPHVLPSSPLALSNHAQCEVPLDLDGTWSVVSDDEEVNLEETTLLAADQRPYAVRYRIRCDLSWNTRSVEVRARTGADDERLKVS